jgi:hypothetical protein
VIEFGINDKSHIDGYDYLIYLPCLLHLSQLIEMGNLLVIR